MNTSLLAGAVLNGMVTGMLYALMGVGLSLILGLLNIPNFAHGVLYALGAYVMISGAKAFGFLGGLLAAIVAVAMLGAAIEYFGVRRLYRVHPDYILLLSFGLSLILTESIILVWGPVGITFQPPALLTGAIDLGVTAYPKYRLVVMVVTTVLPLFGQPPPFWKNGVSRSWNDKSAEIAGQGGKSAEIRQETRPDLVAWISRRTR